MKRAAWNGSQNVEETEETRPMCSVTCEIAARVVIGSRNQVGPAVSASVRAACPSGKKTASSLPRSAVCARDSHLEMSPSRSTSESAARQAAAW